MENLEMFSGVICITRILKDFSLVSIEMVNLLKTLKQLSWDLLMERRKSINPLAIQSIF